MKTVYCILLFFFLCVVGYAQQKTFCQLTCSMPVWMEEETDGYCRKGTDLTGNRQMDRSGENVWLLAEEAVLKTLARQIFRTLPCLQTLTDRGITVSWLTHVPVYSWVEYGTDTLELKKARTMIGGQTVCNNYIHKIRLEDLEAGKTYYYRVCSREILAYEAYSKTFGNTAVSPFYSFRVPGELEIDFITLIFNDIHQEFPTMAALCKQIEGIDYDFVILRRELRSKAFRQAGKKVLVHHIPLWGNETDYTPCRELWGGLLKKSPVDISLNAHTHIYAFHPAGSLGNPFPVVVGGGYELDEATVMVLTRKGDTLRLKVLNTKGQVLQELEL